MRGVVALAAAFALPQTIANGQPFPQRNLILFLTFSVILVSLVLQGLTLPKLIQWLGLAGNRNREEEMQARKAMLGSVLAYIGEQRERKPQLTEVYDEFTRRYERRLQRLGRDRRPKNKLDPQYVFREFGLKLRRIERESIREMRDRGEIDDNILRTLEREIDLLDARYIDAAD
jgi:CPA1 family monovalent cation:H+ antiporter